MVATTPQIPTEPVALPLAESDTSAVSVPMPKVDLTNRELAEFNASRRIGQIALVTRDIYRTMREWVETLGVGPWYVLTITDEMFPDFRVNETPDTEPFKWVVAASYVGDMEIEILQPIYGRNSFERFLRERGEGLHHIKELVTEEQIDDLLGKYRNRGIGAIQQGALGPYFHYLLDTERSVRFILELGNPTQRDWWATIPHTIYPPEPDSDPEA